MSEDLRTDHVKPESPSILTKNSFLPGLWGGAGPPAPLSTPVQRAARWRARHRICVNTALHRLQSKV